MKTEQKEEAEILKSRHEEVKRDLVQKNEDLETALDVSQEVLREKEQEIDNLNEEIFKVRSKVLNNNISNLFLYYLVNQ